MGNEDKVQNAETRKSEPIVYEPRMVHRNPKNGATIVCGYIAGNKTESAYFFTARYAQPYASGNINLVGISIANKVYGKDIGSCSLESVEKLFEGKLDKEIIEKMDILYIRAWNKDEQKFEDGGKDKERFSKYSEYVQEWLSKSFLNNSNVS